MKKTLLTVAIIMALAVPALGGTNYNVCFNTLDADYDGTISKAEFMVAFMDGDTAVFEAADSDKDGGVTHEEWEDYKAGQGFEEGSAHE